MRTALDNGQRHFLPRWRKTTWALIVFTVVMALGATASAIAVRATESVSAAEMRDCMAGFRFFGPGPTREQCDDSLHNGDTVITAFVVVWVLVLIVFFFIKLKRRPG
jgi:hypothetical protein